jgi:hypothetical protein
MTIAAGWPRARTESAMQPCRRSPPIATPDNLLRRHRQDRLIPIGEGHFRRAVAEYVEHYHGERNHQGIGNWLISGPSVIQMTGRLPRRSRLGGLLNFYARAA